MSDEPWRVGKSEAYWRGDLAPMPTEGISNPNAYIWTEEARWLRVAIREGLAKMTAEREAGS